MHVTLASLPFRIEMSCECMNHFHLGYSQVHYVGLKDDVTCDTTCNYVCLGRFVAGQWEECGRVAVCSTYGTLMVHYWYSKYKCSTAYIRHHPMLPCQQIRPHFIPWYQVPGIIPGTYNYSWYTFVPMMHKWCKYQQYVQVGLIHLSGTIHIGLQLAMLVSSTSVLPGFYLTRYIQTSV